MLAAIPLRPKPSTAIGVLLAGLCLAGPAAANPQACDKVLEGGQTEFVAHAQVPARLLDMPCYTFAVPAGWHVLVTVSREEMMRLGVDVRAPGETAYRPVFDGISWFSNADPQGRLAQTDTAAEAREFHVVVGSEKPSPDASKRYVFRIRLWKIGGPRAEVVPPGDVRQGDVRQGGMRQLARRIAGLF